MDSVQLHVFAFRDTAN